MLFGQLPGDDLPQASNRLAALPPYATLIGQYLDRFGPYRLQAYAMPVLPQPAVPAGVAVPASTPAAQPVPTVAAARFKYARESAGRDRRSVGKPVDPVGAGPGVLTGYDQAIAFGDAIANPFGIGLGFSNPGVAGLAGLAIRELAEAARKSAIDKINDARIRGLVNDANRRVAPGTPLGRAGGVGTPGVGGGFTTTPGRGPSGGAPDRSSGGGASNRGPGSRGGGFDHFGGPR